MKNICYCTWCWGTAEGEKSCTSKQKNPHPQTGKLNFTALSHQGLGKGPEKMAKFCGKKAGFSFGFRNVHILKSPRQIQIFSDQVCQFFPKSHLGFSVFIDVPCFYISFATDIENHALMKWLVLGYIRQCILLTGNFITCYDPIFVVGKSGHWHWFILQVQMQIFAQRFRSSLQSTLKLEFMEAYFL